MTQKLCNFVAGNWQNTTTSKYLAVVNPATTENIAHVPLSSKEEVNTCVEKAHKAFTDWRCTPATERIQFLFKLKNLLEENITELAQTITKECGKTYQESMGELRRGIENVEVACGIPALMQGQSSEDIARGIDEHLIRQPLGVVAAITPFNFPAMIPFWFLPYAIATGNCFILKPSEKVPLTAQKIFELLEKLNLPAGVAQMVHGDKETVDAILDHPQIRAVSFVGSSGVAKYIYSRAAAKGKRVQCQGGAKNPVIVMPDVDMEMTTRIMADSAFGCAGQRCLASSIAIAVGKAGQAFTEAIAETAKARKVGYGLDQGIEMGPVITKESQERICGLIKQGILDGGKVLVDGSSKKVNGFEQGHFVFPTVLDHISPDSQIAKTEVFGPVLSLMRAKDIEEAIALVNSRSYGNMACIFTENGAIARKFRYEANAGNIGINVGVAAPMAFFPFSGWGESFFGDLHAQGRHGVEFYTNVKVVVERWPKEWSRKF